MSNAHGERYRIQVCSDVNYERLIAEIYVDDKYVALVSQEDPVGGFKLEIPGPAQNQSAITRKVDLTTFLDAVAEAKSRLRGDESSPQNTKTTDRE